MPMWTRRENEVHSNFLTSSFDPAAAFALSAYQAKLTYARRGDLGESAPGTEAPQYLITTDNVPDGIGSNPVLTVGAPSTIGTIDMIGDQDFFSVTLQAGQSYEIGMYGLTGGPNGAPLSDSYIEIYDSAGNLVVSADGGASTPLNAVNSGLDVLLTFTPTVGGTYYVNARAFDQSPADGDNGDAVGDYELFVRPASAGAYQPYYDVDSPLYALDWGSQVDGTARNPDGNEGTRLTDNAQGTPGASPFAIPGKNVVTIYFAKPGDVFTPSDPTSPGLPPAIVAVGAKDFEIAAVWTALREFEKVADVVYVEVQDRSQANFFYVTYSGTPGPGISLLGSMSPPGESDEGLAQFNSGDYRWNATNLQQGGFSFVTLIHEFGHGHGLAHPHDNGGRSGIMRGVDGMISTPAGDVPDPSGVYPAYTLGDYDLNQAVFTMMSYQDGWQSSPYGNAATDVGYGYLGGLMAFDIAAIQDKYGVNEEWATGNDTYTMKDVNAAGTYYYSIWDAGGIDQIVYSGARNATIDLRAATLNYETGGGGNVSFANGIFGGFTIANGVTIENAQSGAGNDILIGNAVANTLDGGAGNDTMSGGLGNDIYIVDSGSDRVLEAGGEGNDLIYVRGSVATLVAGSHVETIASADQAATIAQYLQGNELSQKIIGNQGANTLDSGGIGGADTMQGLGGDDIYRVHNSGDEVMEVAGEGYDMVYTSVSYAMGAGVSVEVLTTHQHSDYNAALNLTGNAFTGRMFGNHSANVLTASGNQGTWMFGFDGNDSINGSSGNDTLHGGEGADLMTGGLGNDEYIVDDAGDQVVEAAGGGTDVVFTSRSYTASSDVEVLSTRNQVGTETIDLTGSALNQTLYGNNGVNTLDGKGGNDTLYGLAGDDVFAFTSALGSGNVDTLADFLSGADKIALDDAIFAGLGLGALGAGAFTTGTAATTAGHRIIYDTTTGALFFDADGNGAGAAVQFAQFTPGATLAGSDFMVI